MKSNREIRTVTGLACVLLLMGLGCAKEPPQAGGGTGGKAGAGGAGGAAGPSCGSDNPDDLISDFKTDNSVAAVAGRMGGWYVYGDTNGTFTPPKMGDSPYPIDTTTGNPACSGAGSFHVKATGFNLYGAAAGTDIAPKVPGDASPAHKGAYDASMYKGISFWIKAMKGPIPLVQIKFPDVNTDPEVASPKCALSAAGLDNNCSPYIVKLGAAGDAAYANAQIGTSWSKLEIFFADAKQDTFNKGYKPTPDKLDAAHLLGFAIQINADFSMYPVAANDFEIWIDDVRFIR